MRKFATQAYRGFIAGTLGLAFSVAAINANAGVCDSAAKSLQTNIGIAPNIIDKKSIMNNRLCQVETKINTPRGNQTIVFYTTKDFVIAGSIFKNRKNLTADIMQNISNSQFASTWKKYKKSINKVIAATYTPKHAKKGRLVYEIADPNCPFCERMKPVVKKFADKYGYTVKLIFFSFERPSSPKKTSDFICKHRPFVDYFMNNLGTKTCKKGDEYVKKANQMAQNLGVTGTPTFIFARTGQKMVGANPTGLENMMKGGK